MRERRGGMTLIELCVVMGLLTIIMALAFPRLARFMSGRTLNEEAKRFIALSRYARSQAVALGVPMRLWIDPATSRYGLSPAEGYEDADKKPVEFQLFENVRIELPPGVEDDNGQASVLFRPDGGVDTGELQELRVWQRDEESIHLARKGLGGEFQVVTEAAP